MHDTSKKSGTLWSQDDQSQHVSGCPDVSVECHRMLSTACGAWSAPLGEGGVRDSDCSYYDVSKRGHDGITL